MKEAFLEVGRIVYFDMTEELITTFLNQNVDLAYEGHNLSSFVTMIKRDYLRGLPKEKREEEGLWGKIWWFQRLQQILQDERMSVAEALVEGWHWFVDPEQWPTKATGKTEYADLWKTLDPGRRQSFLGVFVVDEKLNAWMSGLESKEFCCENAAAEEGEGLMREFLAAGAKLSNELNMPRLAEEALGDGSTCGLCGKGYSLDGQGTDAAHLPMRVTPCGHIFGSKCMIARFDDPKAHGTCTVCKTRLCASVTSQDLVDACDKVLKWLQPPAELENSTGAHSFLGSLMMIFEPADEIRKRLDNWVPHASSIDRDLGKLGDLGMYLARERMAAVVKKDINRYREAVMQQTQATAQRLWLEFLDSVLPDQ